MNSSLLRVLLLKTSMHSLKLALLLSYGLKSSSFKLLSVQLWPQLEDAVPLHVLSVEILPVGAMFAAKPFLANFCNIFYFFYKIHNDFSLKLLTSQLLRSSIRVNLLKCT